ncbi:MAG: DHH family phosphoesterase [Candidatus Paceibacterota bacterium]
MDNEKQVIAITHSDLDGAGCLILLKLFFNVTRYQQCGYEKIDKHVLQALEQLDDSTLLMITDICPSIEVCDQINAHKYKNQVLIIDHHKTKKWLSKYDFGSSFNPNRCATSLVYNFCMKIQNDDAKINESDSKYIFSKAIDAYDMWKLSSHHRFRGEGLNDLLQVLGFNSFVKHMYININADLEKMKEIIEATRERRNEQITRTVEKNSPITVFCDPNGHRYSVILATQYQPETGHKFLKSHNEIDYVIIVNADENRVSLYTEKSDVDVSEIANKFGGGGHRQAAGTKMEVSPEVVNFVVSKMSAIK